MKMAMRFVGTWTAFFLATSLLSMTGSAHAGQSWPQWKYDGGRCGNLPKRHVDTPLGLMAAAPLTDAVFTSPVVADGRVYVVDGSGVAFALNAHTLEVLWKTETAGGAANCNNVSSPAVVDGFLHFGTMAGGYYVLDAATGEVVKRIDCGEPIFGAPVLGNGRVYFATLGSRVYALKPDGEVCWTWDYVREKIGFDGDRYSPADWHKARGETGWPGNRRDHFFCTRSVALTGKTLVVPAGGTIVWLEDAGEEAELRSTYYSTRESPITLGLTVSPAGDVYRQWHRRDNNGSVEILRRAGDKLSVDTVPGTVTSYSGAESLSFTSVSLRGDDVFRCRPEAPFGFCRHAADGATTYLGGSPSIASPILLDDAAVYGGLDGKLHVVPLAEGGEKKPWSFATAFGKPISAAAAVCDGNVYFGCEDGYLYALGSGGSAALPTAPLDLSRIRSPLTGKFAAAEFDRFTSFADQANTNANGGQGLRPPLALKWIRRFKGTCKHFSVCGGGRMYTHTAEGQIFAVEQETGRLLWRRYFPGIHVSFTSPVFHQGRLFVPQAGFDKCRLRCLDAANGNLLWEAPFSGTPSWNRQQPPIVHNNLLLYQFSTAKPTPKRWLFEHQSTFGFPKDEKPLVRAYDIDTGKMAWTKDFSEHGSGGDDAGTCLLDGVLYYSCYFGGDGPLGVTAAIEPETGRIRWQTTEYAVHAGCTVSGEVLPDGRKRLYLGGYNPVEGKTNRIWCLDANDGSLVWKSEPLSRAIHVVTVGRRLLFAQSQYYNGFLIDKQTGRIVSDALTKGYRCTRFSLSEPYLLGPNLDMFDLSDPKKVRLVSCGPPVDLLVCIGAFVSNGRVFHTTNGSGLQCSAVYGAEAEAGGE